MYTPHHVHCTPQHPPLLETSSYVYTTPCSLYPTASSPSRNQQLCITFYLNFYIVFTLYFLHHGLFFYSTCKSNLSLLQLTFFISMPCVSCLQRQCQPLPSTQCMKSTKELQWHLLFPQSDLYLIRLSFHK